MKLAFSLISLISFTSKTVFAKGRGNTEFGDEENEINYLRGELDRLEDESRTVDVPVHERSSANTIRACTGDPDDIVKCFDEDTFSSENAGEGKTGPDGCVTLKYPKYLDSWGWWDSGADIYCMSYQIGLTYPNGISARQDDVDEDKVVEIHIQKGMVNRAELNAKKEKPIQTNGCGPEVPYFKGGVLEGIKNVVVGIDLTDCCNSHDLCYTECGLSKGFCDREQFICQIKFHRIANTFYDAVDTKLGESAYEKTQDEYCPS